jgi:hypothetical protein
VGARRDARSRPPTGGGRRPHARRRRAPGSPRSTSTGWRPSGSRHWAGCRPSSATSSTGPRTRRPSARR